MGMCWDLKVTDKDTVKELKKVVGEKLTKVKIDKEGYDLELIFEKHMINVSMQDSEHYGTNVFFEVSNK